MQEAEKILSVHLSAAQDLTRDVFQMMYSMNLRLQNPEDLTVTAREYHARILEQLRRSDDFQAIKELCEGRDNAAYEAAAEIAAGQGEKQGFNRQRIALLKENAQLLETMRQLGRLQEMLSVVRKNSFHYGRGTKYSLTHGKRFFSYPIWGVCFVGCVGDGTSVYPAVYEWTT